MAIRFFEWQGHEVCVDMKEQILRLELAPVASLKEAFRGATRKTHDIGGTEIATFDYDQKFEAPLVSSVVALPDEGAFVSAGVFAQKAKAVDDGIVAALELIIDDGTFDLAGRRAFLAQLQEHLLSEWASSEKDAGLAEAIGLISAARSIVDGADADSSIASDTGLRLRRSRALKEFRSEQETQVPMGIYSWSERLTRLYRQGKALQKPLENRVAVLLSRSLRADLALMAVYQTQLSLAALTNPLVRPDLLADMPSESEIDDKWKAAVFPASDSPEGRLLERLVGRWKSVPLNFDLIGELITAVEEGRISLAPAPESGWYDYALYALEPLLCPDHCPGATRLELADEYRQDLRELFRALQGMTRESHVKQLESLAAGGCPLTVAPALSIEPLAEHYRRRADSYRFVRERLTELLGEGVLSSRKRPTPLGETAGSLLDEIVTMEQLFTGAWAIVRDELGFSQHETGRDERRWLSASKALARSWIVSHRNDPDLAQDARMMVPLFNDLDRHEFHVLAVLGYEQKTLKASFAHCPNVTVRNGLGQVVNVQPHWNDRNYPLARPVAINCLTKQLLDRDSFRAVCDREKTAGAIRRARGRHFAQSRLTPEGLRLMILPARSGW